MRRRVRLGCLTAGGIRLKVDGWVVGMGREGFLFEPIPKSAPIVARVHTAFLRFGFDVREAVPAGNSGGIARFAFTKPLRPRPPP